MASAATAEADYASAGPEDQADPYLKEEMRWSVAAAIIYFA